MTTIIEDLFDRLALVEDHKGVVTRSAGTFDVPVGNGFCTFDVDVTKTPGVGLEIICHNLAAEEGDRDLFYRRLKDQTRSLLAAQLSKALGLATPAQIVWGNALRQEDDRLVFAFMDA